MRFIFYSPDAHFGTWDWTACERGIGGSETSHIELCERLAKRGHTVISYAPVDWAGDRISLGGAVWRRAADANFALKGTWIIYRDPSAADHFPSPLCKLCGKYLDDHDLKTGLGCQFALAPRDQSLWLVCQDVDYPTFNPIRAAKFDGIAALCAVHAKWLQIHRPYLAKNIGISSNGIPSDRMAKLPPQPRNPHRLIYSSSPDRGLFELLWIFKRVREYVADAELHVYYGFDNIDKAIAQWKARHGEGKHPWSEIKAKIEAGLKVPGVYWHGRVGQPELHKAFMASGIWCYPTWFSETSCISCMEAQALGAIPVTNPYWPLKDNVQFGSFIDGNPVSDTLARARYVKEIVRLMEAPEEQEHIRREMMHWALDWFSWEHIADQLEGWAMPIDDTLRLIGEEAKRAFPGQWHAPAEVVNA